MKLLRPKRFISSRSKSKPSRPAGGGGGGEIKWELRPGGMLVQKREYEDNTGEGDVITVRVSSTAVTRCHDISVPATSTFGEMKLLLSLLTKLEPQEQRLLFKGKEREDNEHLHMVGVKDKDKLLMFVDPA